MFNANCIFVPMRRFQQFVLLLIIAGVLGLGYATFNYLNEEENVIQSALFLAYTALITLTLVVYRISIGQKEKLPLISSLLTIGVITTLTFQWLDPIKISALWSYTLGLLVLLIGAGISNLINHRLISALCVITCLLISLVLFTKISSPVFYSIIFTVLIGASILNFVGLFTEKRSD